MRGRRFSELKPQSKIFLKNFQKGVDKSGKVWYNIIKERSIWPTERGIYYEEVHD